MDQHIHSPRCCGGASSGCEAHTHRIAVLLVVGGTFSHLHETTECEEGALSIMYGDQNTAESKVDKGAETNEAEPQSRRCLLFAHLFRFVFDVTCRAHAPCISKQLQYFFFLEVVATAALYLSHLVISTRDRVSYDCTTANTHTEHLFVVRATSTSIRRNGAFDINREPLYVSDASTQNKRPHHI